MNGRAPSPAAVPVPVPSGAAGTEEAREHYLQRLLDRLEGGEIEPYEYTRRVQRLEGAAGVSDMAEIVEAPVSKEQALDAVDMLLLSQRTQPRVPGGQRPKFFWMALMAVFFVVLMALGLWLMSHAKALHNSGNVATVTAAQSLAHTTT